MHCARHQARSQAIEPELVAPAKDDIINGRVIRQHADDDVAFEQILDFERRPQAERRKLLGAVGTPDIGRDLAAAGGQVGGHDAAHATKPNKPDPALDQPAGSLRRSVVPTKDAGGLIPRFNVRLLAQVRFRSSSSCFRCSTQK